MVAINCVDFYSRLTPVKVAGGGCGLLYQGVWLTWPGWGERDVLEA